jgi:hypothetical protein
MTTAPLPSHNSSKPILDDDQILAKAVARFNRDRRKEGLPPCQPSIMLSDVAGDTVILRNVNGELARYRISPSLLLRLLPSEESGEDSPVDDTIGRGCQPHWVSLVVKRTVTMSVQVIARNAADAEEAVKTVIQEHGLELEGVQYLNTTHDYRGYCFVREQEGVHVEVHQIAAVPMSESRVIDLADPSQPDPL